MPSAREEHSYCKVGHMADDIGIAIRIETASGALVGVDALQPLLRPTAELLGVIAGSNGPRIDEARLCKREYSIPFVALEGHPVYCTLNMDVSLLESEARWIMAARQRELALAFARMVSSSEPPSHHAAAEPTIIGPVFLLACALETAGMVRKSGHLRRLVGKYIFEGSFVSRSYDWSLGEYPVVAAGLAASSYKLH